MSVEDLKELVNMKDGLYAKCVYVMVQEVFGCSLSNTR
jgi:hypothetical protein